MSQRYVHPLIIGSLQLKNNLILAPMAGITDQVFRCRAHEGGAGLVCSEMVSAAALMHGDRKTRRMLMIHPQERPVSIQMFGAHAMVMAEAARIIEDAGADIVDINFGCPVRKIVKSGAGARLLENKKVMIDIMEAVVKSVKIPVTVKTRIGTIAGDNTAPEVVRLAAQSGVSAVTVHGRAAEHFHKGMPELAAVRAAVEAASIPVIGNGGIVDEESAIQFFQETGCAGIMIGRGALENPEIFERIERYDATREKEAAPSWEKRFSFLQVHAQQAAVVYGEHRALVGLRKVAPYYLKGLPHAAALRDRFNHIETLAELEKISELIYDSPYFESEKAEEL